MKEEELRMKDWERLRIHTETNNIHKDVYKVGSQLKVFYCLFTVLAVL